jgi:hypothetical protein
MLRRRLLCPYVDVTLHCVLHHHWLKSAAAANCRWRAPIAATPCAALAMLCGCAVLTKRDSRRSLAARNERVAVTVELITLLATLWWLLLSRTCERAPQHGALTALLPRAYVLAAAQVWRALLQLECVAPHHTSTPHHADGRHIDHTGAVWHVMSCCVMLCIMLLCHALQPYSTDITTADVCVVDACACVRAHMQLRLAAALPLMVLHATVLVVVELLQGAGAAAVCSMLLRLLLLSQLPAASLTLAEEVR